MLDICLTIFAFAVAISVARQQSIDREPAGDMEHQCKPSDGVDLVLLYSYPHAIAVALIGKNAYMFCIMLRVWGFVDL